MLSNQTLIMFKTRASAMAIYHNHRIISNAMQYDFLFFVYLYQNISVHVTSLYQKYVNLLIGQPGRFFTV